MCIPQQPMDRFVPRDDGGRLVIATRNDGAIQLMLCRAVNLGVFHNIPWIASYLAMTNAVITERHALATLDP
jgi:hypothetical protein